jgi:hypothetical protein
LHQGRVPHGFWGFLFLCTLSHVPRCKICR